jgi:nitrogen fixation NifU-like protein
MPEPGRVTSPYNDVLLEHYRNPRNVGEIEGSPAVAQVGDPATGDVLRLSLLIEGETVVQARFKSFGCTAAIAAGSVTTILLEGKRLADIESLTNRDVAAALGGLPESKRHCSVLAEEAIQQAVASYRRSVGAGSEGA